MVVRREKRKSLPSLDPDRPGFGSGEQQPQLPRCAQERRINKTDETMQETRQETRRKRTRRERNEKSRSLKVTCVLGSRRARSQKDTCIDTRPHVAQGVSDAGSHCGIGCSRSCQPRGPSWRRGPGDRETYRVVTNPGGTSTPPPLPWRGNPIRASRDVLAGPLSGRGEGGRWRSGRGGFSHRSNRCAPVARGRDLLAQTGEARWRGGEGERSLGLASWRAA